MRVPKLAILFLVTVMTVPGKGQDTTMLLSNMNVQIEATQAINDLYNFKYEDAERQFRFLKYKYRGHPLPFFLLGLSEWWKIMPNIDNTEYDEKFMSLMDTTIQVAERLYENDSTKIEGAFFLSAAYGFKGRLLSERKSWRKAASAGKNALKYLEVSKGKHDLSIELLFGDALYNYFSVWIPENYPLLKPILIFFPKGDKELGIEQLREVSNNAFYTRTEAQIFLMRILRSDNIDANGSLQIAEYLATTFPDNSYFQRYYAMSLYTSGRHIRLKPVAHDILSKIDSGMTGYGATAGRYAAFFLGQIHEKNQEFDTARYYYQRAVEFGEEIEAYETGYYLFSLLHLAQYADNDGDTKKMKEYLKLIRKHAKRKHPAHKEAREYLRNRKRKKVKKA